MAGLPPESCLRVGLDFDSRLSARAITVLVLQAISDHLLSQDAVLADPQRRGVEIMLPPLSLAFGRVVADALRTVSRPEAPLRYVVETSEERLYCEGQIEILVRAWWA